MKKIRKGSAVKVLSDGSRGTVTEVRKNVVRVLFPIRKFAWIAKSNVRVIGFDGDGSSVGWR
jgi:hypothetical protein